MLKFSKNWFLLFTWSLMHQQRGAAIATSPSPLQNEISILITNVIIIGWESSIIGIQFLLLCRWLSNVFKCTLKFLATCQIIHIYKQEKLFFKCYNLYQIIKHISSLALILMSSFVCHLILHAIYFIEYS